MAPRCSHLAPIRDVAPRTPNGCEESVNSGGRWVHRRLCRWREHMGCRDSAPHRHARQHAHATDHPIVQSFEPREDWRYCFVDDVEL